MPPLLDKASASALVKLTIFIIVTTLATSVLAVTIGNLTFGDKTGFKAVFSDVTGLSKGDEVRISGVRVGTVDGIEVQDRDVAVVTFEVDDTVPLSDTTSAMIRYRNLIGQRYVALVPGEDGAPAMQADDTIPLERTTPALDLTVLFQGFQPLFDALSPEDVNQLSFELIQVLQGEGGTVESLLDRTASLTSTLANRDELIGDTITNLNDVLVTFGSRDEELSQTISTLQQFTTGLRRDRQAILGSLDSISELAVDTADLVSDVRPILTEDIRQLRRLAGNLEDNRQVLDTNLKILPVKLQKIGRTASYGSWFNFYLCNFRGQVVVPQELADLLGEDATSIPIDFETGAARCTP